MYMNGATQEHKCAREVRSSVLLLLLVPSSFFSSSSSCSSCSSFSSILLTFRLGAKERNGASVERRLWLTSSSASSVHLDNSLMLVSSLLVADMPGTRRRRNKEEKEEMGVQKETEESTLVNYSSQTPVQSLLEDTRRFCHASLLIPASCAYLLALSAF